MMGSLHASHAVLICSNSVQELTRGVRNQIAGLIRYISYRPCLCSECVCKDDPHTHCKDQQVLADICGPYSEVASEFAKCACSEIAGGQDLTPMSLGLSHSLSRYKLKFSPDKVSPDAAPVRLLLHRPAQSVHPVQQDKEICALPIFTPTSLQVDTMIVQAIALLDDLDKELNTYAMRVREWYGWHFPEMTKIVADNILYAKTVRTEAFMPGSLPCRPALLPVVSLV